MPGTSRQRSIPARRSHSACRASSIAVPAMSMACWYPREVGCRTAATRCCWCPDTAIRPSISTTGTSAFAGCMAPSPMSRRSGRSRRAAPCSETKAARVAVPPLYLTYLNALDVEALALTDDEILVAIEQGLAAQGRRETVIEPRMHLIPDKAVHGHFNVLRGAIRAPINLAGVKVISDYVDNYQQGLPSELGLLLLMDPTNGVPKAIIDGSHLTDMRTGAVTAIGAKHLARKGSKVLGHVGARGTAYWNVRLLDRLFDFDAIRVHSAAR